MRRVMTIADIAAPSPRSIAIGPFGSALRADRYVSRGVPVVRGQNIGEAWGLMSADQAFVSRETADEFPGCLVRPGDLVFPHRGAIGRVARVSDQEWLLSSSMMKLTVDPDKADSRYVLLYFRDRGREELLAHASTVGTPGIGQPLATLRSIPIPIPPLAEQRAIADVLGALDDKIEANKSLSASVDHYLAALFEQAASDATDVPLRTVAEVNHASAKPRPQGYLRYIDIASVAVGSFEFPDRTSWDEAPGRARRGVATGDTIWSTVRPNRRSHALVLDSDPELVASTGLAVLSPREVGFAYLYEATKRAAFSGYLENVAEGSAYPAVRADRFLDAPIPLVDAAGRAAFEEAAAPLRRLVAGADRENRTLAETRDTLLPHLMSGTLRVRDAEAVASTAGA